MTTATSFVYERPWLYPQQLAAIFCPERYAIIEASTKSGKTVGCMAWLSEQAMAGAAGRAYWWVAPYYPVARIAYRRLKRGFPPAVYVANETELTLTLANGAVLAFKSAEKPDALYGEDVYAAVIDEATRCKEEAWHALRSTLTATRGPVRIIGNVKGRRNWAYRLARRAEAGEPAMHYARITAHDAVAAGVLDAAEIDDARRQLPENVFRELYLAEPSDDEGNPFGPAAIAAGVSPLSAAEPVCWGWDVAKSHDWTVGIALDADGVVCRFVRWQKPWQETIDGIRQATGRTRTLVDSTGVGDPILEALQRGGAGHFTGFHFSQASKQQLMEGLAVAIQRGEIHFPEGVIRSELEAFEYEYTRTGVRYSAPAGMHDDCVCALALAVAHRPRRVQMVAPVGIPKASVWGAAAGSAWR
ncbi:MAG TPA: terminase family protein [Dehalococcoidia bacterium]|nr:terminase family protein [Dehalococcoidia bacterium]